MTPAKFLKSGIAAAMVLFAASSFAGPVTLTGTQTVNTVVDASTSTNTIRFTQKGIVESLTLSVAANHSWIGDLFISLTHAGTTVTLLNRPGKTNNATSMGDSSNLWDSLPITFDDSAFTQANAMGSTGNGNSCNTNANIGSPACKDVSSFIPVSPLSAFNGKSISGDWTLAFSDRLGGQPGTLAKWSLTAKVNNQVPEPSTLALLPLALGGAFFASRRRKAAAK